MERKLELRQLFKCEDWEQENAIFLGRLFLFLGGVGLVLFRMLHDSVEPGTNDSFLDRILFTGAYWVIIGLSFLPPFKENLRWFILIVDLILLLIFPAHAIWAFAVSGYSYYYLVIVIVVILVLYLPTRNRSQIWGFFSNILLLTSLAMMILPPENSGLGVFIFATVLMVGLVGALANDVRIQQVLNLEKAKAAKIASESTLRSLITSSQDLIWSMTPELRLQEFNEAFDEFTQKFLNRSFSKHDPIYPLLVALNWQTLSDEVFQQVLMGEPFSSEVHLPPPFSDTYLQVSLYPIRQGDEITGISGFARDLSLQKKNQDLLKGLMANSLSGIMSLKSLRNEKGEIIDFTWTSINEAATKIIPFLDQDILGKTSTEVVPDSEGWSLVELSKWVVESGKPVEQEFFVDSPTLKKRWFHLSIVKLKDGVAITFMDITKRKATEAEYQKLSLVASHAKDAIIITNSTGRVEWCNRSFSQLTGYELEELKGRKPGPILQGKDTHPETVNRIREQLKARVPFTEEILNYHKNGAPYWASISFSPVFDKQGRLRRFIAIKSDITKRIQAEQELTSAKEAAESAAVAKSQFLATMSHEIRTPMNAVIGLTSLLVESELSREQSEMVETIRFSGENLLTIINDILDFSKIEAGKLELESQPYALRDSLLTVIDLLSTRSAKKGLYLDLKIDEDLPHFVASDPTRLSQILMNLIGNGIKFTENGGVTLRVSIAPKEFQEATPKQQILLFQVVDTGIGIPQEKLNRLFQTFSQVDASITRRFGGTGLGLAISKRLVELMGGQIWVSSREGAGSRFSFTLPIDLPEEAQTSRTSRAKDYSRPLNTDLKVLIVEDNAINQKVAARSLKKLGLEAEVAGNGEEALDALELATYDLIFMDMQMPVMDGLTATREIRRRYPDDPRQPLIIAMTANAMAEDRQRCLDAGMNDYISKPIRLDDIRNALQEWFGQDLVLSEASSK
ncbi:MAG: PAS domain S-box protein [Bacteroidota bacterium]